MTTSALVPGLLPVAINGHPYLADPSIKRETVQVIRQQSDTSTEAGEQSLTPYGLWRRSQESWHHGAGQDFLDGRQGDVATDPHRFRSSKGVDPWTKGQVSLLHPTIKVFSSASSNLYLAVSNPGGIAILYVSDGTEVYEAALPYSLLNTLALQRGTGWTATNATIATISEWFKLTATAAAVISAISPTGTNGIPVEPGREYGMAFQSNYLSGGSPKTPTLTVTWYTAAGASISSSTTTAAAPESVSFTHHAVAPPTAAFAAVTVSYTAASAIGEAHEVRTASFGPLDDTGTFGGPDTWTALVINAGQAAQAVQSIASDGTYLWAALGTSGLHRNREGVGSTADVPAAPASGQVSLVGYANGFLLAAGSAGTDATRQNSLWLVTDPLGTPALSLIKTHPNVSFAWTGIGPGRNCVYAWGNSGGNGEVYKVLFDPNTGSLSTAASFATYLPDGETIHALQFYAGGIIMGTGKGVRIGTADGAGNIDYGPLVPTLWPVRCLEPQDRYCWFGWTKYNTSTSGLGRIDLGFLTDTLTPAWASDLMTSDTSTGDVVSVVTFAPYGYQAAQRPPVRVFTVAGEGVYIEDPGSRVNLGTLETGMVRFGTSESKAARYLDVRCHALAGGTQLDARARYDSESALYSAGLGPITSGSGTSLALGDTIAEGMEFEFDLARFGAGTYNDYTRSPEMTRWTAKVLPLPSTIDETFTFTLHMKSTVDTTAADGQPYRMDVQAEMTYLKGLEQSRAIVDFQVGNETFEGYVVGSHFLGENWEGPLRRFAEGKLQLQVQTLRG